MSLYTYRIVLREDSAGHWHYCVWSQRPPMRGMLQIAEGGPESTKESALEEASAHLCQLEGYAYSGGEALSDDLLKTHLWNKVPDLSGHRRMLAESIACSEHQLTNKQRRAAYALLLPPGRVRISGARGCRTTGGGEVMSELTPRKRVRAWETKHEVCADPGGVLEYMAHLESENAEMQRRLDDERARAEQYEAALVARHGGEPLALLAELDEARAQLAAMTERARAAEALRDEAEKQCRGLQVQVDGANRVLEKYSDTLRGLASAVGAGGLNSEGIISAEVAEKKIRWGIDHLLNVEMERAEKVEADAPGRLKYPLSHEWHAAINRHHDGKIGTPDYKRWMYEAKAMADEVPRMAALFGKERRGELTKTHRQCSQSPEVPVPANYLTCCLGVKCAECPALLALDHMERVTPEEIDRAKAWTCAAHIVSQGGDQMNEGYLLTVDDRMYWNAVHKNLAAAEDQP